MTKLSDTQLVLLSSAAKRDDGALIRPPKMKSEAAEQAVGELLARKLIKSVTKSGTLPVWKKGPDNDPISLIIMPVGLEAIGIESGGAKSQPDTSAPQQRRTKSKRPAPAPTAKATGGTKRAAPGARPNSKIARVVEMMRKPGGVTLNAIMRATDWQAHSVRGAISGAIKKKLGLKVVSETRSDERVYRIGS
jgi:hypothetical protein